VCEKPDQEQVGPLELSAADRRLYRRIARAELQMPADVRIQNRPAVSLIDLSAGGALLELPFQMTPDARVTLELLTAKEKIVTPFRLLRCYVQGLQNGIRYHVAGAFEQTLNLPTALTGALAQSTTDRVVATLDAFLQHDRVRGAKANVNGFDELLAWVMAAARRGESVSVMSSQIRSQLSGLFPTLAILPANGTYLQDPSKSARFFGFDFKSRHVLAGADRRLLRAAAQLIAVMDAEIQSSEPAATETPEEVYSSVVTYSVADWQAVRRKVPPLSATAAIR
jgi:hypothetical protein